MEVDPISEANPHPNTPLSGVLRLHPSAHADRLSENELRALIAIFDADCPNDVMLRELLVLRDCNAIVRGLTTIKQVLDSSSSHAA